MFGILNSKFLKLFFGQFRLLENTAECSGGHIACVHRYVSLPAVCVTQHDVGTGLAPDLEACALQSGEHVTRFVRHRQEFRAWKKSIPQGKARIRRSPSSRQSRAEPSPR